MEIKFFDTTSEALNSIMRKDKEYKVFVRHFLEPGKGFRRHRHPEANEWVIIGSGTFEVAENEEKKVIEVGKLKVAVVYFPKNICHTLKAVTSLHYCVLRDKKDKIIYC